MKKPNRQIKDSLNFFKYKNNLHCRNCEKNAAHFSFIKVDTDDIIHFIFNCSGCGHDYEYVLTYEKLRKIYFQKELKGDEKTLWAIFQLGMYFDACFKFEHEKPAYLKLVCRLNKDASWPKKYYYRRKYATD